MKPFICPGWVKHWIQDKTHYFCFLSHPWGSHLSDEEWQRRKSWNQYKRLTQYIQKHWRRFLPNIGLSVELPFNTRFRVVALYERVETYNTIEIFRFDWHVYRWGGYFDLYWKPIK